MKIRAKITLDIETDIDGEDNTEGTLLFCLLEDLEDLGGYTIHSHKLGLAPGVQKASNETRAPFCPLKIRDENACPKCGGKMFPAKGQVLYGDAIFKCYPGPLKDGWYCEPCGVFVFDKEDEGK